MMQPLPSRIGEMVRDTSTIRPSLCRRNGFVLLYPLAPPEPCNDLCLFFGTLSRYDPRHRLTKHFLGAVAKQASRAFVPTSDDPLQAFADNGVLGRLDDGGEPRLILRRLSLLGNAKLVPRKRQGLLWESRITSARSIIQR